MKKSTQELLETMKKSGSYNEYLEKNREDISSEHMKIDRALSVMLKEKKLKKSDCEEFRTNWIKQSSFAKKIYKCYCESKNKTTVEIVLKMAKSSTCKLQLEEGKIIFC